MPSIPQRDLRSFCQHVAALGWRPATVIDVGVCYGTPELHETFPDAHFVLIEPVPSLEERMRALVAKFGGEYHMIALGDRSGTMALSVPKGGVEGSSLLDLGGGERVEVPVRTLDEMFAHRSVAGPVLLKTDCQGFDLNVMRGGERFLPSVDLVVMEVNMFPPFGNAHYGDFTEIVVFMRERGFVVYDILGYQTRPFDNALGYVDLAFVKTDGWFRREHRWN